MLETYKGSVMIGINHLGKNWGLYMREIGHWWTGFVCVGVVLVETMSEMLKEWVDSGAERGLRTWSWSWGNLQWWMRRKAAKPARKPSWYLRTGSASLPRTFSDTSASFCFSSKGVMSVNEVKSEKESMLLHWWRVDLLWIFKCLYLSVGHLPLQKRAANLKQMTGVLDHRDRYSALQHK